MTPLDSSNQTTVCNILTQSFLDNKSVNYIIKQDRYKHRRIEELMNYSYKQSSVFGKIYLNADNNACALLLYPDKKRTTLKSMLWDVRFIIKSMGISNIKKALQREAAIKKEHPNQPFSYLWFIGVDPSAQGKGIGSALMQQIISDSEKQQRPICLETSTVKNLPWYEKFGFKTYRELDFGYKLYCLKRD